MIGLIVATQSEAAPVISELKLKKVPATLSYYKNNSTNLVISGMGKCCAAMACGWLGERTTEHTRTGGKVHAWLNFGIAGHKCAEPGTLFAIHKATDLATGKVWFPHRIFPTLDSSSLVTVDKPMNTYLPDQCHDMEASGFIEAARRFTDAELVQSLKVVSDNEKQPLENVNSKMATALIEKNIQPILQCVKNLQTMAEIIAMPHDDVANDIIEHWRFTVAQTVQLERLLQKYQAVYGSMTSIPDELKELESSKAVLSWLQSSVERADYTL